MTTKLVVTKTMTDLEHIKAELQKFGLTRTQTEIYLLLVTHKELRIGEIVKLSKIPRSSVYESLKRLYELGIAEEVIDATFKRIRPYSVGVMKHGLDEKILGLKRLTTDLHKLEKLLTISPPDTVAAQTAVRFHKGRSGARQLYWNTLKTQDTVCVMSDWGRGRYVGMRFYENFVSESRQRQIKEKVLVNPTADVLASIKQYTYPGSPISRTKIEDIRALDSKIHKIQGDTLIYDQTYAYVYLKKVEINGFEVVSSHFTDTQRSIFEASGKCPSPYQTC